MTANDLQPNVTTDHDHVVSPRLGIWSVGLIALFVVIVTIAGVAATAWQSGRSSYPSAEGLYMLMLTLTIVGIVFGLASGAIWIASWIRTAWIKYASRILVVVAAAMMLNALGTYDWLRNLSNMGGLCLAQCTIFLLLKVPAWSAGIGDHASRLSRRRQFQISDVILATACTAGLLTVVRHYSTPVSEAEYWIVTVAIWLLGPLMATCVNFAFLDSRRMRRWTLAAASVLMAIAGGTGLALAQEAVDATGVAFTEAAPFYLAFMFGYVISLSVVAFAGAFDQKLAKMRTRPPRLAS
ncbi:hypothetical protein [Rubripirellula reticaptiva]|uniref:hypothetical protein n=1 Tax=Rubripirellula reticaptiva TaxID=2528013 RepID=UPI001646B75C|nr:hypothetical protein [Rubripirellula reticaptiva]